MWGCVLMPVELGLTDVKRAFFETIGYVPHPKQLEFHASEARFKDLGGWSADG